MFRNPTTDALVVLLIVLLIFGPKRLPALGKQLGAGIREFKDSITGKDDEDRHQIAETSAPAAPASPPPAPASASAPQATPPQSERTAEPAEVASPEPRP
jgi:sec-independent protein translocase protein TatA